MPTIKNLDTKIVGRDFTTVLKESEEKDASEMTVRIAIKNALLGEMIVNNKREELSHGTKFDLWLMAKRVHESPGSLTITNDEYDTIKTRVGTVYSQLVVGQVFAVLNADPEIAVHQSEGS